MIDGRKVASVGDRSARLLNYVMGGKRLRVKIHSVIAQNRCCSA